MLHQAGFSEPVVAAALLHDVVEDTSIDLDEICRGFGLEIQQLVGEMTEDEEIEMYGARKAEHRKRMARSRRVAAIYAADKVANTRDIRAGQSSPDPDRLDHFRKTLELLCEAHPDLPFLGTLRHELEALRAEQRV